MGLELVYFSGFSYVTIRTLKEALSTVVDLRSIVNISYCGGDVVEFLVKTSYKDELIAALSQEFFYRRTYNPAIPADKNAPVALKTRFKNNFRKRLERILERTTSRMAIEFFSKIIETLPPLVVDSEQTVQTGPEATANASTIEYHPTTNTTNVSLVHEPPAVDEMGHPISNLQLTMTPPESLLRTDPNPILNV